MFWWHIRLNNEKLFAYLKDKSFCFYSFPNDVSFTILIEIDSDMKRSSCAMPTLSLQRVIHMWVKKKCGITGNVFKKLYSLAHAANHSLGLTWMLHLKRCLGALIYSESCKTFLRKNIFRTLGFGQFNYIVLRDDINGPKWSIVNCLMYYFGPGDTPMQPFCWR